jgi:tetratricopeptide (TPR) repeat protein
LNNYSGTAAPSYPPLEAYRRDAARLGDGRTFGPDDGAWVAAAMLLQRYVEGPASGRTTIAAELARFLAPDDALTFPEAGLRLAAQIDRAGALHLAASWLNLLDRVLPPSAPLVTGRTRAQRASVARKLGALDAAHALYADAESIGETHGEPELSARAWIGYGVLAHMRGNYPDARRWYRAALLVADDNHLGEQSFQARQGLMIAAAVAGDFDSAMREGWQAYVLSSGDGDREAEVLTNIAQALYECGRHHAALRGFAAAVARTAVPTVLLPALGGAACAAAALRRRDIVEAAAQRVEVLSRTAWAYPLCSVLLDLADAHARLGANGSASAYRDRARIIAIEHRFHELHQRAERADEGTMVREDEPSLGAAASRVVTDIECLDAPADLTGVIS